MNLPSNQISYATLIKDLSSRKEFNVFEPDDHNSSLRSNENGFAYNSEAPDITGLQPTGPQQFIRNIMNPNTDFPRILINWQTGTGKTSAAVGIANEFIRQYKARTSLGENAPSVFIIGFTKQVFQAEMLRFPEHGFISASEVIELQKLEDNAKNGAIESKQLSNYLGMLRRRLTDRTKNGYFQFYGYKVFANNMFIITPEGFKEKFDINSLATKESSNQDFGARLIDSVRRGLVKVNTDLLDSMRGGLIIVDEVHNVYNIVEKNNYGIAIQYALDVLGEDAPRAVFMSATPMTGSAAEIVDLLNLLIPNENHLVRTDFFKTNDNASSLKEGALAKIAQLAVGRVSFLLDSDTRSYPRRIFAGTAMANVPYLLITECPMSPMHEATLNSLNKSDALNEVLGDTLNEVLGDIPIDKVPHLPANAHTLYDMVYPNPNSETLGLYISTETPFIISKSTDEWKQNEGIIVETQGSSAPVITGPFLESDSLKKYSTKYYEMVKATISAVQKGPGKIMIYHHRVHMSGVIQIAEILRMNGFIDEYSESGATTLCGVCGIQKDKHSSKQNDHAYTPARYAVAHSDIDRSVMTKSIKNFNSNSNLEGYTIRVLIGSRIVKEGYNFRAVRHQFIMSLPIDYPTLIQVFGRVVRKFSHLRLPLDQQDVTIRVFITTFKPNRMNDSDRINDLQKISPELLRYMLKGREYLIIQEVERALRQSAIDTFVNEKRIRTILNSTEPTIDGLPLAQNKLVLQGPTHTETYYAYNYAEREIDIIVSVCRALFKTRPVWTYGDLYTAVKSRPIHSVEYDLSKTDEGNFAAALEILLKRAKTVVLAGKYYIGNLLIENQPATFLSTRAVVDYGSYLTHMVSDGVSPTAVELKSTIDLRKYLQLELASKNFSTYLKTFENAYLIPSTTEEAGPAIEMILIDYGAAFHFALLRRLIEAANTTPTPSVTIDDKKIIDLYLRFRVAVTADELDIPSTGKKDRLIGYVSDKAIHVYNPGVQNKDDPWKTSLPLSALGITRRHKENNVVVGFIVSVGEQRTSTDNKDFIAATTEAKFKIRPPVQSIGNIKDIRSINRGAVCTTRPRTELMKYIQRLRALAIAAQSNIDMSPESQELIAAPFNKLLQKSEGSKAEKPEILQHIIPKKSQSMYHFKKLNTNLDYAVKKDTASFKRFPSANELCTTLKTYLLALEENARSESDGMSKGLRWLYLFNDTLPVLGVDNS